MNRLTKTKELLYALIDLRHKMGVTQVQVAELCNMHKATVSNIETGTTTPMVAKIDCYLRAIGLPPYFATDAIVAAIKAWQEENTDKLYQHHADGKD
jgi:transcriptional regulator with XRE-family HTH domain